MEKSATWSPALGVLALYGGLNIPHFVKFLTVYLSASLIRRYELKWPNWSKQRPSKERLGLAYEFHPLCEGQTLPHFVKIQLVSETKAEHKSKQTVDRTILTKKVLQKLSNGILRPRVSKIRPLGSMGSTFSNRKNVSLSERTLRIGSSKIKAEQQYRRET